MIRVLLVNETQLMCNVISTVLEDEPDIHVVACCTSVQEATLRAEVEDVDIMLVSTRLPDNGALKLTQSIIEKDPDIKVLALGLNERKEHVLQFVEAGAVGYIRNDDSVDDLLEAIRAAQKDQAQVSPAIAVALMERVTELTDMLSQVEQGISQDYEELTPRELEVLNLIAQGFSNQEIADELIIEVGTVKNHVHNILNKLDVSNRQDAAMYLGLMKGQDPTLE